MQNGVGELVLKFSIFEILGNAFTLIWDNFRFLVKTLHKFVVFRRKTGIFRILSKVSFSFLFSCFGILFTKIWVLTATKGDCMQFLRVFYS